MIFILIGYCAAKYDISRRFRYAIYFAGIAALIFRFVSLITYSYKLGYVEGFFCNYTHFYSILLATAVFVFLLNRDWSVLLHDKTRGLLRAVSSASFGVYLVHFYLLRYLVDTFCIDMHTWKWRVFGALTVYFVSLTSVLILKKLPFVKYLVP